MKSIFLFFIFAGCCLFTIAQPSGAVYAKDTKAENRTRLYKNLVNNAITKNLSFQLTDSTEENWADAFNAMELIRYHSPWANSRIRTAFDGIEKRSLYFQRALLELVHANYPFEFVKELTHLLQITVNDKVFVMCAACLMTAKAATTPVIKSLLHQRLLNDSSSVLLKQLDVRLGAGYSIGMPAISELLQQPFFANATVLYSFQRKNRNYPGRVIIRDSTGNFVKSNDGNIFSVPQLARSISNLPSYLTNGNTPQGIFRMKGLDISRSNFIGPTPNIQLCMPIECSLQHFMNDSTITDSVWTEGWYKKLLPESWKNYLPIFDSYFAGQAGRTEIIAHGTTVNPEYYKAQPYYPLTPTLGCLCTKEIWNESDGSCRESDQQLLVTALQKAGGANGYCVVIELNDEQRPVTIDDILSLFK